MGVKLRHQDLWLARLSAIDREALIQRLRAVDASVFERDAPESFDALFAPDHGREVVVRVYFNDTEVVGFCVVRVGDVLIGVHRHRVVRTFAAMTHACRGAAVLGLSLRLALRERLRHPLLPVISFEVMTHPWSYAQVAGFVRTMAPRYSRSTSDQARSLTMALADHFGIQHDDPANPFVCSPGYRTRQSEAERDRWAESNNPDVRFFHRINPRYYEGRAMLGLISVTWADTFVGVGSYLAIRMALALEGLGLKPPHGARSGLSRKPTFGPRGELYD